MTRLISLCDKTLEASWLTAIACVPLFFGPWAEVLQSEKSYLLRSISILLLTVWIIRCLALLGTNPEPNSDSISRTFKWTPAVSFAVLLFLVWAVATTTSIDWRESFWGDATRRHGTFSLFCCLVFFLALLTHIRSHEMVDRLLTVCIVTTVPICSYGIAQKFGFEPLIFAGSDSFRVGSTFRNPVFLSAYLIMVFPVTLSRLISHWPAKAKSGLSRWKEIKPAVIYGTVAILQLTAILFTVSRGPTLGLIIGLFVAALMMANYWRKRWFVFVALSAGLLLMISFLLIFFQVGPFSGLAKQPSIQRFTSMFGPRADSSGRAAIWKLASEAAQYSKRAEISPGQLDLPSSARFLLGYGPESVRLLSRVYRSPEYNGALEDVGYLDRFHNDFWDTLLTTGIAGLLVWTSFWIGLIYSGFKWLGFIADRRQTLIFWSSLAAGAIAGSVALTAWQGAGFLGVGQMLGISSGLMAFLAYRCLRRGTEPSSPPSRPQRPLLVMALLSALIAHLVEIQFSFPTETTLLFFWVWAALIILEGRSLQETKEPLVNNDPARTPSTLVAPANLSKAQFDSRLKPDLRKEQSPRTPKTGFFQQVGSWNSALFPSAVIAMILAYLGEMLILSHLREGNTAMRTLWDAFSRLAGNQNSFSWFLPASIIMAGLLTAALFKIETDSRCPQPLWLTVKPAPLMLGGFIGLIFCYGQAAYASRYIAWTRVNLADLDRFLANYTFLVDLHYAGTLVLLGLLAFSLPIRPSKTTFIASPGHAALLYCVAILLAFAAVTVVYRTSMAYSKTEVLVSRADYFKSRLDWKLVEVICRKGLSESPRTDSLYRLLSESLIEQGLTVPDKTQSTLLLLNADQILKTAGEKRPYEISWYVRRGDLSRLRAERSSDQNQKVEIAREAIGFYQIAARLDPFNDEIWYRMAFVSMAILNSPDTAIPWLERSIQCYPKSHATYALLGNAYFAKGAIANDPATQRTLFGKAADSYQNAIKSAGSTNENAPNRYLYTIALAKCSIKLKDMKQAIQSYKDALEVSPPAERWTNEEMLGRLYIDLRDKTNSLFHLNRALELAPPEQRTNLLKLQRMSAALP